MDLITNVKVNSINSLTDARFFSGAGVPFLGFCFAKSNERYIPTEKVFQIKEWLVGPQCIGEFSKLSTPDEVNNIVDKLGLDYVHLSDGFSKGGEEMIKVPVFQEVLMHSLSDIDNLEETLSGFGDNVEVFVLNFAECGFAWNVIATDKSNVEALASIAKKFPIYIDTFFDKENIVEVVESVNPKGIILPAGDELDTGIQSFEEVADLLELLEAEL